MKMRKNKITRQGHFCETNDVNDLRDLRISYYTCLNNAIAEASDDEAIVRLTAQHCRHGWYMQPR